MRILLDLAEDDECAVARIQKKREKILGGGVPPPVFCKRVRKLLIEKELSEHSFLKSAEESENRRVIFWHFLQKSERPKRERALEGETRNLQRPAEEGIAEDPNGLSGNGRGWRRPNIRNDSMVSTNCQQICGFTACLFESRALNSNGSGGSQEVTRSWQD